MRASASSLTAGIHACVNILIYRLHTINPVLISLQCETEPSRTPDLTDASRYRQTDPVFAELFRQNGTDAQGIKGTVDKSWE